MFGNLTDRTFFLFKRIVLNVTIVSKVCTNNLHGSTQTYLDYEQMHIYYWHSDHLGSATLITDYQGKEYERIEYTPYGELWIDQNQAYVDGYLPYRFTGKELDEETGLYYYGQRYLDPQYNIRMTSDPAIYDFMSQSRNGEGGIYNIINLDLYHYAGNNPVKYMDPDGRFGELSFISGVGLGIATLAEDIFSFGAGIADDPLTLAAAAALIVAEFAVSDAATSVTDGSVALPGAIANQISRTEEKADTKGVAVSATDTKKNDSQIMYHYSSVLTH